MHCPFCRAYYLAPSAMAVSVAFIEVERAVPSLSRGWRTPDPSPTRTAVGLPRCAPAELAIKDKEGKGPASEEGDSRSFALTRKESRTPSPPPVASKIRSTSDPIACIIVHGCEDVQCKTPVLSIAREPSTMALARLPCLPCPETSQIVEDTQSKLSSPPPAAGTCVVSKGSVGHPVSCKPPCKYQWKARRKNRGECKDGALCDHCHLCDWKQEPKRWKRNAPKGKSQTKTAWADLSDEREEPLQEIISA